MLVLPFYSFSHSVRAFIVVVLFWSLNVLALYIVHPRAALLEELYLLTH